MHHHDYAVVSTNNNGQVEVCKECKHRLVIKKDKNGRIDNSEYVKTHVRDTAQPSGATARIFNKYYGASKNKRS